MTEKISLKSTTITSDYCSWGWLKIDQFIESLNIEKLINSITKEIYYMSIVF